MAFNPDKFLAETKDPGQDNAQGFDPDKFISETSDQQTLGQQAKQFGSDVLNIAAKPFQAVIAPFSQAATAASNYVQGNPQEPLINPIVHPVDYLNKYGTTKPFFESLPVGNAPVAYGISPNDVAGFVSDIGIAHVGTSPFAEKISEGTQQFLESQAEKNRVKTLSRISGLDDTSKALASGKIHTSVDTLKDYGIADQISNPAKLHETLMGKVTPTLDSFGNKAYVNQPGLISNLTKEVNKHVDALSAAAPEVDSHDLVDKIYNDVANRASDPTSMSSFSGKQDNALLKRINDIIEPDQYPTRSIKELIAMKRNSADKIWELGSGRIALPVEGSTEAGIHQALWKNVDNHVKNIAQSGVPGSMELVQKNNDLSNLLRARDLTINAPLRDVVSPSIFEAATAQAAGTASGHAMIGSRPARGLIERQLDVLPARTANAQEGVSNMLSNTNQQASQVAGSVAAQYPQEQTQQVQANPQGRFPQSVPDIQQQLMMRKGLVENLAEYKIPRTAEGILQNPKLALAKLAQTTNNKAMVDGFQDAIMMHPELLKNTLPAFIMQFPQVFAPNRFPSWSNGKLLDPMDIQTAYKEVENKQISNTQKVMLQDGLNRDGTFPESF